jgi:hypothetical protein
MERISARDARAPVPTPPLHEQRLHDRALA